MRAPRRPERGRRGPGRGSRRRPVLLTLVLVAAIVGAVLGLLVADPAEPSRSAAPDDGEAGGVRLADARFAYAPGLLLDVYVPDPAPTPPRRLPVVLMLHGCCGDRADLAKLAEATARAGAVVLSADWPGLRPRAFPAAYGAVGCALRVAAAQAERYGGDPRRLVLVGWSDGAMAAAVVALAGGLFPPTGCAATGPLPRPLAFVGVAGFYGWSLPVPSTMDTARGRAFLGGSPSTAPGAWRAATPYSWLGRPGPPCITLLVGRTDPLVSDASRFAAALRRHGHLVELDVLPSGGDPSLISPRSEEGKTTVSRILSAASCAGGARGRLHTV